MYKIIAIIGESGAGKDSIAEQVLIELAARKHLDDVHEIVHCTSRPIREYETDGVNYYFYHPKIFEQKIMDDEMLEFTRFNNWWYGTGYDSMRSDGVVNIGVFNPAGVRQLLERAECEVYVYRICVSDKTRLVRQLDREAHPDVREIVRRFNADYEDFQNLEFDYIELVNEDMRDFYDSVEEIVCQVETLLAQGQK